MAAIFVRHFEDEAHMGYFGTFEVSFFLTRRANPENFSFFRIFSARRLIFTGLTNPSVCKRALL